MKVTKRQLKRIIREEKRKILREMGNGSGDTTWDTPSWSDSESGRWERGYRAARAGQEPSDLEDPAYMGGYEEGEIEETQYQNLRKRFDGEKRLKGDPDSTFNMSRRPRR